MYITICKLSGENIIQLVYLGVGSAISTSYKTYTISDMSRYKYLFFLMNGGGLSSTINNDGSIGSFSTGHANHDGNAWFISEYKVFSQGTEYKLHAESFNNTMYYYLQYILDTSFKIKATRNDSGVTKNVFVYGI